MVDSIGREEFRLSTTYLNTAYFGPSPLRAEIALSQAIKRELDPSGFGFEEWRDLPDQLRESFGRFVGCPADSVAVHSSVSEIVSQVAFGWELNAEDAVVVFDGDYPSDVLPWMEAANRRQFNLVPIDISLTKDIDRLLEALPKNLKVLTLSHTQFNSGFTVDLKRLLPQLAPEVVVVVDATQSLGAITLSPSLLKRIDVLATAGYKWLLGPYGVALASYSQRALNTLKRTHVGWLVSNSSRKAENLLGYTLETLPGARKFDRGQAPSFLTHAVMHSALEFLNEIGAEKIQTHNRLLVEEFLEQCPEGYTPVADIKNIAGVVCLSTPVDTMRVKDALTNHKIDASVREGNLRLSFHLFNSSVDVGILIEALESANNKSRNAQIKHSSKSSLSAPQAQH